MSTVTVTPAELGKELNKIVAKIAANPEMERRILVRGTLELADITRAYPPAGPWNSAPGSRGDNRWYQRQYGPRWIDADGTTGGENTSEQLQKNWKTEITPREKRFVGSVFTVVSYAPKLYTPARRARWAAAHGWRTTDEIAEGYKVRFAQLILEEINKEIKSN